MILENGVIRTLDPSLPIARALAVAGGRIAGGIGTHETALASPEVVDLGGRCVQPGITDSHVPFATLAVAHNEVRLEDTRTIEEAVAKGNARHYQVEHVKAGRGVGHHDPQRHIAFRCPPLQAIRIAVPHIPTSALNPLGPLELCGEHRSKKFGRQEATGIASLIAGICMANPQDEQRIAQGAPVFENLYQYFRTKRA